MPFATSVPFSVSFTPFILPCFSEATRPDSSHFLRNRLACTYVVFVSFAVEFLVKNFGKKKLLLLIKSIKDAGNKAAFAKKFRDIYGFELNYNNFNK